MLCTLQNGYFNVLCSTPLSKVWTSELLRTHQTSAFISAPKTSHHELNELDSGDFDDLTYAEFEAAHPAVFRQRELNKLTFRYPGGESYVDVCRRLERLLPVLDKEHNLLLICHQVRNSTTLNVLFH